MAMVVTQMMPASRPSLPHCLCCIYSVTSWAHTQICDCYNWTDSSTKMDVFIVCFMGLTQGWSHTTSILTRGVDSIMVPPLVACRSVDWLGQHPELSSSSSLSLHLLPMALWSLMLGLAAFEEDWMQQWDCHSFPPQQQKWQHIIPNSVAVRFVAVDSWLLSHSMAIF